VVAERHDVRARGEQLVGELAGDPGPVGDVLAVDDAEVGGDLYEEARQTLFDSAPPGDAEYVREKEESQFRTSDAAGRSSIVT
jgi:hypothetical protein